MEHIPEPESRIALARRNWVRWICWAVLMIVTWASGYLIYGQDMFLAWFIRSNLFFVIIILVIEYFRWKEGRRGPLSTEQTQ